MERSDIERFELSAEINAYNFRELQKAKIRVLMMCQNFEGNVESFIDHVLENEALRIRNLTEKADPVTKDWPIAYLDGFEDGMAERELDTDR